MLDDDAPPKELLLERRYSHVRCECEASPLDGEARKEVGMAVVEDDDH